METTKERNVTRRARSLPPSITLDREGAREIGMKVASNLSKAWRSVEVGRTGPIRVVDMFSGCGGMSTGFKAVNAEMPLFKLVGAADIDEVANRTYKTNLGFLPSRIDISSLVRSRREMDAFLSHVGVAQ